MTKSKGIRPPCTSWPSAQDATLREMWCSGASFAAMSERFGRTKNAIIGRAHRLGFPPRKGDSNPEVRARNRAANRTGHRAKVRTTKISNPNGFNGARAPKQPLAPLPPVRPVLGKPRSIAELERRHCRYIGERPEVITIDTPIFCGAQAREGSSYCETHHALCWTAPRPRRAQDFVLRRLTG